MPRRRLRILTWHVHGNYLYYLTQVPHDWYVLSKPDCPPGYAGRSGSLPWGDNVHDMPVSEAIEHEFDCVVYQSQAHYLEDRIALFTLEQEQAMPRIFLEHDPPQRHPTDTRHPFQDRDGLLVHVTQFNRLMWDNGVTPTRVIDHGVLVPDVRWTGEVERGIAVVNNMRKRGRRLGLDVFRDLREHVPIDLIGMDSESEGGRGEVRNVDVPAYIAPYRFYFHPCRYTSLALATVEAMTVGLPVVGLATTELATVIRNGENGFLSNDPRELEHAMRELLADRELAERLGDAARETAQRRFGIARYVRDWTDAIEAVCANRGAPYETAAA